MTRSAALSLLLAVALAAPAGAHTLRRAATPVIVTAGPALAGCPVPPTAQVGAEVEPHVAVDPSDPRRMAVAWQQDRATDGAARALGVA
ncbi:MAG: exo-alpha-sialidase, partial [Solirubrobacterales bacterium]|nr:exo-alpha-sialidase [Solirubrobacterales bacterium]